MNKDIRINELLTTYTEISENKDLSSLSDIEMFLLEKDLMYISGYRQMITFFEENMEKEVKFFKWNLSPLSYENILDEIESNKIKIEEKKDDIQNIFNGFYKNKEQ